MLPPLRPRYYSISSSPLVGRGRLQHHRRRAARAGPLRARARSPASAPGTSRALPERRHGLRLRAVARRIAFRPPENPHTPMIMVGAGHRAGAVPRLPAGAGGAAGRRACRSARSLLFFGCRDRGADLPLRRRAARLRAPTASSGWTARSPATADAPSRYVQDAMLDCADEVWELLQHDAAVFVCGNAATMAPGVRSALMHDLPRQDAAPARPTRRPGSPACAPPTASWRTSGAADPPGESTFHAESSRTVPTW